MENFSYRLWNCCCQSEVVCAYRKYLSTDEPLLLPVPGPVADPPDSDPDFGPEAAANAGPVNNTLPTPAPSTDDLPIGDGEKRQYTIIPANASEASLIPLVGSGSRHRLSAAKDEYEAIHYTALRKIKEHQVSCPNIITKLE
ncbi:hypothetical protein J6590_049293 [Homalodisca vitripennis]|nr:hypothetical protein J6590_049293 [Homalodisca vitripennis]